MREHIEGGYFSETHRSAMLIDTDRDGKKRSVFTSIFYMLTDDRPIGYFHMNKSDIMHYFHAGSPLTYYIIEPNGELKKIKLGPDIYDDQHMQLLVKGGCWKATVLEEGDFGLLGESVSPGFEYKDMRIGKKDEMQSLFPHLWPEIDKFVKV